MQGQKSREAEDLAGIATVAHRAVARAINAISEEPTAVDWPAAGSHAMINSAWLPSASAGATGQADRAPTVNSSELSTSSP